jgi:hypothetical protein
MHNLEPAMTKSVQTDDPPLGLGLTALILGAVGLILSFLPILSIPLDVAGLIFGLTSLLLALLGGWTSLRWSIVGVAVAGLALAVGIAIARAPAGYMPNRAVPLDTQPVPDRPYVPPPARPTSGCSLREPIILANHWSTKSGDPVLCDCSCSRCGVLLP